MRARHFQNCIYSLNNCTSIAPTMQIRNCDERVSDWTKVRVQIFRHRPERPKRPHFVPEPQQQIVWDCKQTSFQRREDGKLVIRPLDRIQRCAYGFHFLTLMERSRLPKLMWDATRL